MDDAKKKQVKIILIASCLILAVLITLINRPRSSGSSGSKRPMQMLCSNEECNAIFEISPEDMREQMMAKNPEGIMAIGMRDMQAFTCIECEEESAFIAAKCSQCDFVHVLSNEPGDYPDRCPECDYSATEERLGK